MTAGIDRRTILAGMGCATLAATRVPAAIAATSEDSRVTHLLESYADYYCRTFPEAAAGIGRDTGEIHRRIDDRSGAVLRQAQERAGSLLKELRQVDPSKLDRAVLTDLEASRLMLGVDAAAAGLDFPCSPANPYVVSQMGGAHWSVPQLLSSQLPLKSATDAQDYLARLRAYATALDQENVRLLADAAIGFSPPTFIIDKSIAQIRAQASDPAERAPVVAEFARAARAAGLDSRLATNAAALFDRSVRPALNRQIEALVKVRTNASAQAGLADRKNGGRIYSLALRQTVTTDASAASLHALGLERVSELSDEIDRALRAQGMTSGSVAERLRALFTDPRYLYANDDTGRKKLLDDLNGRLDRMKSMVGRFTRRPLLPVEIRRMPIAKELGAPYGWYDLGSPDGKRPSVFYINLRNLAETPSWTLPTLVYHETIPGHHIANSITSAAKISTLRKLYWFSAFDEGWAMYGEQLADEVGEYRNDPVARVGYLQDILFRAVRLVVDTGIHSLGWSREQAIAYYLAHLGKSRSLAETEIDRYCVMPGQACSYLVGKEAWLDARERARRLAGPSFSLPTFHDSILTHGPIPVGLLPTMVELGQRAASDP